MKVLKILLWIIAIPLGIFLFVFGGYDDSPGAQLLGFVIVMIGIVGVIKSRRKKLN